MNPIKYLEDRVYRLSVYLLVWSLLRHDKRYGGKHQNIQDGATIVQVGGRKFSLRWLLYLNPWPMHEPNDECARFAELSRRMDRAAAHQKSWD